MQVMSHTQKAPEFTEGCFLFDCFCDLSFNAPAAPEAENRYINKSAHKNAIENAKRNNIDNIEFHCADAGEFITKYDGDIDVLIMDPPRSGSDETFLSTVMNKRIKKIVYVSCNPETLARDIQYLSSMYEVNYVQPVDMFPMTAHVETVVELYRK